MLKNNKILKAQMGISIPVTLEGLTTAGALETLGGVTSAASTLTRDAGASLVRGVSSGISMGNLAMAPLGLAAYAMTRPSAASGAVRRAHVNQLARQREEANRKEQQYWNNKADYYAKMLSDGPVMTDSGVVVTRYDPSTRIISGYKDGSNGNRIFADKNLQTGEYLNPVVKDGKTGAYYEGTIDSSGPITLIGRGENLMPYSIIPGKKPEWTVSIPSDILESTVPIMFKKKAKGQTPAEESKKSGSTQVNPEPNDPENKSKLKQIWEILKGKSNASSNTSSNSNYSTWEKWTLQDKPWGLQWGVPKAISAYLRYVTPTEAAFKALGWIPINSGPTYTLFPVARPIMDRIANTNSQENQTQQIKNTEKDELPDIPIAIVRDSTSRW